MNDRHWEMRQWSKHARGPRQPASDPESRSPELSGGVSQVATLLTENDIVMRRAPLAGSLVLAVTLCSTATLALGETFPSKPVKITAPYSAGAAPATFTRVVADKLS